MTPRILLISEDTNSTSIYANGVIAYGAEVMIADYVLPPDWGNLLHQPYNGAMIDIRTAMRTRGARREFIHEIGRVCPTVRVQRDENGPQGFTHSFNGSIEEFVNLCRRSQPRQLRRHRRVPFYSRVTIFDGTGEKAPIHTLSMDISEGGIFLFSPLEQKVGDHLVIDVPGLGVDTYIPIEVRRVELWQGRGAIPGFGAQFLSIEPDQIKAIQKHVRNHFRGK